MPTFVFVRYGDGERLELANTPAAHAPILALDIEHGEPAAWPTVTELVRFPLGADVYVKTADGWKFGTIARWIG